MATTEEIQRRVEQADTARSTRRTAAEQRVGELARRRAVLAEELEDIERALGDELADAHEIIDVDELASFTDVPAADLTRWLTTRTPRKAARAKRKRTAATAAGEKDTGSGRSAARTPPAGQASTVPGRATPRAGDAAAPERAPVEVG